MTFPSFQNTIFSFSGELLVDSVSILSYLKGKNTHTQCRDYDLSFAISVQFPQPKYCDYSPLTGDLQRKAEQ